MVFQFYLNIEGFKDLNLILDLKMIMILSEHRGI